MLIGAKDIPLSWKAQEENLGLGTKDLICQKTKEQKMVRYSINYKTFRTFDGQRCIWIYTHVTFSSFFLIIWVDIWVEARVHILRLWGVILLSYYYKSCLRGFCCVPRPKLICANSFCFLCSCLRVAFSHRQRRTGPGAGTCGGHTIDGGLGWLLPRLFQEWHCPVRPWAASLFSSRRGGQPSERRFLFIFVLSNEVRALSKVDKDLLSYIP